MPAAAESEVNTTSEEVYPYKAEALFACASSFCLITFWFLPDKDMADTGSLDDPTELAFRKGEILEILTKSDRWWQARTLDGKKGSKFVFSSPVYYQSLTSTLQVAPSNYLREISTVPMTLTSATSTTMESGNAATVKPESQAEEFYPYKAEALYACECPISTSLEPLFSIEHADSGSSDDPRELSFRKGEILDILTKSDMWWEARKSDGTKGSEC